MNLRRSFHIFCAGIAISLLTSCLNSEEQEFYLPIDAQITSFYIGHDSIPALDSLVFSIDHFNGLIYNHDSLRYGVEVYEKVIVGFTTSAIGVLDITHLADGDSTIIMMGDSLDLSEPVRIRVYAYSGETKEYEIKLNIHTVDPDEIEYSQIADNLDCLWDCLYTKTFYLDRKFYTYARMGSGSRLYSSSDAVNWEPVELTGFYDAHPSQIQEVPGFGLFAPYYLPGDLRHSTDATSWQKISTEYPVVSFFGRIEESPTQKAGFAMLVQKDGKNIPAFTPDFINWEYGTEVPSDFPVADYSVVNYTKVLQNRLSVIGGKNSTGTYQNTVWSTTNGVYWAKITSDRGSFPVLEGCNAFMYDDKIHLLNGRLEDGSINKTTYISVDGGVTWKEADEKIYLPEDYVGRYGASVVVDENNYQYIIGGRTGSAGLTDVWKGILNKLAFKNK